METKLLADKQIIEILSSKEKLIKTVEELTVNSKETEITAVDLTKQINEAIEIVEDLRKTYTKPYYDAQKMINTHAKELKEPFEEMERALRRKCIGYHDYLEEQREKERIKHEKKMEKAIENNKPLPVEKPIEAETKTQTENAIMSYTKKWFFEIVDVAKIPREYMIPDEKKIRKLVQAGIREIAGVRIYEETRSGLRKN